MKRAEIFSIFAAIVVIVSFVLALSSVPFGEPDVVLGAAGRVQTLEDNSGTYVTDYTTSAFSSNTTNGNTIICAVVYNNDQSGTASLSDSESNSWSKIAGGDSGGDTEGELWYAYNITGGASHTITVTFSANYHDSAIICREYSGLTTTDPLDKSSVQVTFGTSHTSAATAVTTQDNELVVAAIGASANVTCTAGTGYGNVADYNGSDLYEAVCIEDKDITSTGAQSATITTSASVAGYFIVATFKEPAARRRILFTGSP